MASLPSDTLPPVEVTSAVERPASGVVDANHAAIATATGVYDYAALYSTHEYKKVRVRYFTGDVEEWENECGMMNAKPKTKAAALRPS